MITFAVVCAFIANDINSGGNRELSIPWLAAASFVDSIVMIILE